MLRAFSVLVLGLLAACGFDPSGDPGQVDPMADGVSVRIGFANEGRGAAIDVPIPITLTDAEIDYAAAALDGSDLRFIDSDDATVLAHEIERWTPGGASVVWVRVPELDADSSSDYITLVYGDGQIAKSDPASVWREYSAVYHLDVAETAASVTDSSPDPADVVVVGTLDPDALVAGVAGGGLDFVDQYLELSDTESYFVGPGQTRTIEAWVRTGPADRLRTVVANESSCQGWALLVLPSGEAVGRFAWGDGCGTPSYESTTLRSGSLLIDDDRWHYLALVIDRVAETVEIYVDGTSLGQGRADATMPANGWITRIAAGWDTDASSFIGQMDEVRISTPARDAAWIATTFAAMTGTLVVVPPR